MRHSETFGAVIEDALRKGATVRFRAEGTSMYPTIRHGDTITVVAVSPGQVARGDVLLCHQGRRVLAHRVVGVTTYGTERVFQLKGDARIECDAPVSASAILGAVIDVRRDRRLIPLCRLAAVAILTRAVRAVARVAVERVPRYHAVHVGDSGARRFIAELSMTMEDGTIVVQHSDDRRSFVTRDIGGETLIVPVTGHVMDLQSIYVLNPVGSRIWELLRSPTTADRIADVVAKEFAVSPQDAAADTNEFLESLRTRGLIQQLAKDG